MRASSSSSSSAFPTAIQPDGSPLPPKNKVKPASACQKPPECHHPFLGCICHPSHICLFSYMRTPRSFQWHTLTEAIPHLSGASHWLITSTLTGLVDNWIRIIIKAHSSAHRMPSHCLQPKKRKKEKKKHAHHKAKITRVSERDHCGMLCNKRTSNTCVHPSTEHVWTEALQVNTICREGAATCRYYVIIF